MHEDLRKLKRTKEKNPVLKDSLSQHHRELLLSPVSSSSKKLQYHSILVSHAIRVLLNEIQTMKYLTNLNLILICLSMAFVSCEKDLDTTINVSPKLCFNCILNPDSTITATVSLSQSISSKVELQRVLNSEIKLIEEGKATFLFKHTGNGKYKVDKKPTSGATYRITVRTEGYPTLEATTGVPSPPKVSYVKGALKPKEENKSQYSSFPFYPVTFTITDEPGENRYWIYSKNKYTSKDAKWIFRDRYYGPDFIQYDDFNKENDATYPNGFTFLFYMRIIDTGIGYNLFKVNEQWHTDHNYIYYFMETDEHYDKYQKSTIKQYMGNNEAQLFIEPTQIYTNIENGLGVFGSVAITSLKL